MNKTISLCKPFLFDLYLTLSNAKNLPHSLVTKSLLMHSKAQTIATRKFPDYVISCNQD